MRSNIFHHSVCTLLTATTHQLETSHRTTSFSASNSDARGRYAVVVLNRCRDVQVNQPPILSRRTLRAEPACVACPQELGSPPVHHEAGGAAPAAAAGRAGGGGAALLSPPGAALHRPPLPRLPPPPLPGLALRRPPQAPLPPGRPVQHGRPRRRADPAPAPVPPAPARPPPRRVPPLGHRRAAAPRRHRHAQGLRPRPRHAVRAPPPRGRQFLRPRAGPRAVRRRRDQDLDVGQGTAALRGSRRQDARRRGRRWGDARRRALVPGGERHHRARRRHGLRRQDGAPRQRFQSRSRRPQPARHTGWPCIRRGELH